MLSATVESLLKRLPGPVREAWPEGERFVTAFAHGTMSVELYAPKGVDTQQPHAQDELYFIHSGSGDYIIYGQRTPFSAGMTFFAPAGVPHHFENFSEDFVTWVVFWGPKGGEGADAPGSAG